MLKPLNVQTLTGKYFPTAGEKKSYIQTQTLVVISRVNKGININKILSVPIPSQDM